MAATSVRTPAAVPRGGPRQDPREGQANAGAARGETIARHAPRVEGKENEAWIRLVREIWLLAQQIDQEATQPRGERRVTWALAWTLDTSEHRIRSERCDHGLDLGELAIARALATATAGSPHPVTVEQIIGLHAKEGGWGEVFRTLQEAALVDVRGLGQVVRQIRAALIRAGASDRAPVAGPRQEA